MTDKEFKDRYYKDRHIPRSHLKLLKRAVKYIKENVVVTKKGLREV